MSLKGKAYIAGAYEHPIRRADDKSVAQLHAEVARGALADAGLTMRDVDGYFCAGDAPGLGALSMVDYMGMTLRHVDTTETGGSSYVVHVAHAAAAIAAGRCNVALITLAGRPKAEGMATGTAPRNYGAAPDVPFELPYGRPPSTCTPWWRMRHMHEYGTTSEQLAWIKVAASHHAQHNPHAMLRDVVTVQDVVGSPMIADPLHRLDCCVISDGGGALVVVRPEIARQLKRPLVKVHRRRRVQARADRRQGRPADLPRRGLDRTGSLRRSRREACRHPVRVDLRQLHDHRAAAAGRPGLLQEGRGRPLRGRRQPDLRRRQAALQHRRRRPVQQPPRQPRRHHQGHRSGAPAARRSAPAVQVKNCRLALAQGTGGSAGQRHGSGTLIMERE
jgi:acetyl-CoA C-acetyltransferase